MYVVLQLFVVGRNSDLQYLYRLLANIALLYNRKTL
jgi:hypothetical protein